MSNYRYSIRLTFNPFYRSLLLLLNMLINEVQKFNLRNVLNLNQIYGFYLINVYVNIKIVYFEINTDK